MGIAWGRPATAQGTTLTWTVDGMQREALVFAPQAPTGSVKRPLIFAFHGHGGNAQVASRRMRFQELWPEAIVVYPQGLPTPSPKDPNGLRSGWQKEAGQLGDRDLKFVDAILLTLRKDYGVDAARVYAAGFSNGAAFSYLLWAERAKDFAGFGIGAGALSPSTQLREPRPALVVAGETDPVLPFEKQQAALQAARQVDQATGAGQSCGPLCTFYPSTVQAPVLAILHPGGHVFRPQDAQAMVSFFQNISKNSGK